MSDAVMDLDLEAHSTQVKFSGTKPTADTKVKLWETQSQRNVIVVLKAPA